MSRVSITVLNRINDYGWKCGERTMGMGSPEELQAAHQRLIETIEADLIDASRVAFILFNEYMNEFATNMKTDPGMARETMKRRMKEAIGMEGEADAR